jgi:hypothetical protein
MPPVDLTVRSSRLNVAVGLKVRPTARARNSRSETLPTPSSCTPRVRRVPPHPPRVGCDPTVLPDAPRPSLSCSTTRPLSCPTLTATASSSLDISSAWPTLTSTSSSPRCRRRRWREEVQERQKKSKNGDASSSPTSSPSSTRSHLLPPHHLPPRLRSLLRWNRRTWSFAHASASWRQRP